LRADGSSDNSFEGKGATGTDNEFNGTITVTVIEVLPNGNLLVSGEKQVGINQNVETLRFSGVVNPATVLPGNLVSSTQIADARLEVRGRGDIDRAQTTGWLTRFFLSFLPI
jgi:flagellar L-ring protein precursor FlgH